MRGRLDIANTSDVDGIAEVLTDAFASDPLLLWMFPDPLRGTGHRYHLMRVAADQGLSHGHAYVWRGAGDAIDGAALWSPPGTPFFVGDHGQRVGDLLAGASPELTSELAAAMAEARAHEPDEPHFHLQFFGVRPSVHGRGIGTQLLQACLQWFDRLGRGAFLESSNPRNVSVYQRQGFEVCDEIHAHSPGPDGSPPVIRPMWRPPGLTPGGPPSP